MCSVISKIGFGSERVGWTNSPLTDVFPFPLLYYPPVPMKLVARRSQVLFTIASTHKLTSRIRLAASVQIGGLV